MTNQLPAPVADMLAQLGGNQIFAMAFKSCTYDVAPPPSETPAPYAAKLVLTIAPALVRESKTKATHVTVTLGWDDTYAVKLEKVGKINRRTFEIPEPITVAEQELVYADTLATTVETMTGFVLSLGIRARAW